MVAPLSVSVTVWSRERDTGDTSELHVVEQIQINEFNPKSISPGVLV